MSCRNSSCLTEFLPYVQEIGMACLSAETHFHTCLLQQIARWLRDVVGPHLCHTSLNHHLCGRAAYGFCGKLGIVEKLRLVCHYVIKSANAMPAKCAYVAIMEYH